jgi:hypothetical protein
MDFTCLDGRDGELMFKELKLSTARAIGSERMCLRPYVFETVCLRGSNNNNNNNNNIY